MNSRDAPAASPPDIFTARGRVPGWIALLALPILLAYLPALRSGFIWDDDSFLTKNPLILASSGLRRLWFTTEAPDYWPVTSTTFWLEWRIWGLHAAGYHATNLALHLASVLLLWKVLRRLQLPGAWLAALLFGLHPVNVESVAWITQRKNLLAMAFFLLSVLWFLQGRPLPPSDRARADGARPRHWYWLSLTAFVLSGLSKGSTVVLPLILTGITVWHRRPTRKDGLLLLPFFLSAAALALVNVWFSTHGSAAAIRSAGLEERVLGAAAAVWFYLSKAILPTGLTFIYPAWHIRWQNPFWWIPLLAVVGATAALWAFRRRGSRRALFAWGFFGVALVPVLGLADVNFMKYSLVADHYQHLALIGVVAFAAAAWAGWSARVQAITATVVAAALGVLTFQQCLLYRDIETLFEATLRRNPDSWVLHYNLGNAYFSDGRNAEALQQLDRALRLEPGNGDTYLAVANVLQSSGRLPEAIADYEKALQFQRYLAEAHNNLGNALRETGREKEAFDHYREALNLRPDYPEANCNLGVALAQLGRRAEAIACYEAALRSRPGYAEAHNDLGNCLRTEGRYPEAIAQCGEALRLKPSFSEAHNSLGAAFAEMGRLREAMAQFREALRLQPGSAQTHDNLGLALQLSGRAEEADAEFKDAARLRAQRQTGAAPGN